MLVEVVRSGLVESRHRGCVVGIGPTGAVLTSHGDVRTPVFPRSASKPLQAAAMVHAGLDLPSDLLAVAAASHSGADAHIDAVRRILAGAGLPESALRCPPDLPIGEPERRDWVRSGRERQPVAMNCSGKHAAMLATCVTAGWNVPSYLAPDHPLQVSIQRVTEEYAGEAITVVGVDGCGAPLLGLSLVGVANAFRTLTTSAPGTPARRVADAMRLHPVLAGGHGRDVTALMHAVPGLVAKDGAEGVYAAATADGRAVAVKIEDGAARARMPVLVAVLRELGVDTPGLDALAATPVYGGGAEVGAVRCVLGG